MIFGLVVLALTGAQAFADVECKATYRLTNRQGLQTEEVKPVPMTYQGVGVTRLEIELAGVHLSALVEEEKNEIVLFLVKGPDYINGVTARASLSNGFARLASTDLVKELVVVEENGEPVAKEINTGAYTVYKIECYSR